MEVLTEANFKQFVEQEAPQYVLLDFYSPHCPPCNIMMRAMNKLNEKIDTSKIKFAKINIDEGCLGDEYEVENIPTLVLLKDGVELKRSEGCLITREIKEFIKTGILDSWEK